MPSLTVLSGPNCAGKTTSYDSLFSLWLLPVMPVNLDLLEENLTSSVNKPLKIVKALFELFNKLCFRAIQQNTDFAFECNLRDNQLELLNPFIKAGYNINIIYLCLNSLEQSMQRAEYRYIYQNGILIEPKSIKHNFIQGLKNLDNHFQDYNKVIIIDNSSDNYHGITNEVNIKLEVNNGQITSYDINFPPSGLKTYLPNISKLIEQHIL